MARVLAYHAILCNHGFWLPNDPRGSKSTEVRATHLQPFGDANPTESRRSVAHQRHDQALRRNAKNAMMYPEIVLDGHQALSIANGFGRQVAKSGYMIYACSILPQHTHLVVRRHHYRIEQIVRLLKQAATEQLIADDHHPLKHLRTPKGGVPSVWCQDFWKVFLFTIEDIKRSIKYVEENPVKEGKKHQRWRFITPFDARVFEEWIRQQ